MKGTLFIISTPIGNLGDVTYRAVEELRNADFIACEDTRHSLRLLNHLNIKKPLISFHQHSGVAKVEKLLEILNEGKNIALISDAGTPGVSDPGADIIRAAIKENINLIPIPGVTAGMTALSISGLDTNEFVFVGFLPHKKGRQTKLKELALEKRTIILYESPFRIKKLLSELIEFFGDRKICVSRELTKKFEENIRGNISDVLPQIKEKGEFVVVVEGHK